MGRQNSLNLDRYPSTVLDIGSGTGATALAFDLLDVPRHITLTGVEPSAEMRTFAGSSRFSGRVTARYIEGSVSDGALSSLPIRDHDLLVFSATFPYHFDDWQPLLEMIGDYDSNKMILVVEPDAKSSILDSFARRLRAKGWPTTRLTSNELSATIRRDDIPLRATTSIHTGTAANAHNRLPTITGHTKAHLAVSRFRCLTTLCHTGNGS